MDFEELSIEGPLLITPRRLEDPRGWFSETFREDVFAAHVPDAGFVQHNQSLSHAKGVVRGLHFQVPPAAQGKLVRCLKGAILDVVVDIRRSSPTFGRHVAAELTAESGRQLWAPKGFAHGFVTLVEDTEVFYLVTDYYSAENDRGLAWNDPALGIDWGIEETEAILSEKDRNHPRLAEMPELFP